MTNATILSFTAPAKTAADDLIKPILALTAEPMKTVNTILLERLHSSVPLIPQIGQYIIGAGGKRLRPVLTIAASQLCGGAANNRAEKMAACVELIHTATLLHDDVVDASDLRRGQPSANAMFGNEASVLVGDFLFSRAFQLMTEDGSLDVLRILSATSAVLAEGEVHQLMTVNDLATSEQTYLDIIRAKSAEMFAAAAQVGASVANADEQATNDLRSYGMNLGIAFQIIDDVLDYSAREAKLGKRVGDDFAEGKITLPVIFAAARSTETEREFWQRTLVDGDQQEGDLAFAQLLLQKYNCLADCMGRAQHYVRVAHDALTRFPTSDLKTALHQTADFVVAREF